MSEEWIPGSVAEQGCGNQRAELVTGRQLAANGEYENSSPSDDEAGDSQTEGFPGSRMQPAECDPHDTEDGRWFAAVSSTGYAESQEMVLATNLGCGMKGISCLPMLEILSQVSCTPELLTAKYCEFRQLLGNSVRNSHIAWVQLKAADSQHPLLKVVGLAFGVISTPETAAYMEQQWNQLQELFHPCSPDYIMARAIKDYALAWAYRQQDLRKAFNIVKAFYDEMENGNSDNFFLAPCYTVTIGRWTYDANYRHLSFAVIERVEYYADKALRQIRSLKDEWARVDMFGVKLNALLLLLRVREFYTQNSINTEKLERKIEDLLEDLQQCQLHPQITLYDMAGYYSVRKIHFENVNSAEFCRSAASSARLFRDNGRMQRALEEAKLSGDAQLVLEMSQEAQDVP